MERLTRMRPEIAALWSLEKTIGTRAFGLFPFADIVPPEMYTRLQQADDGIRSELKSGKFDAGLAPKSFKDDLATSRPVSEGAGFSVTLANADRFRFEHYVNPQYPLLAKQARVTGTVE